ncbi:MAG: glutamate synthase subunit beta [Gammaproteobacteria bacterium]|nr:MAG: glutamate synthase subunit beta [Gammaproteobacteria bacterium]
MLRRYDELIRVALDLWYVDNGHTTMDDPYGFLRYSRQEARKEPVPKRVRHWHEYVHVLPDRQATRQADRCMDCGTPCCHYFCPVHNLIPEWNSLVFNAHWQRAYRQLDSTNNFPEFTGRLCPAPCEHACTLSLADYPVTIKSVELAIAERAWQQGWVHPQTSKRKKGKRVVVVGSGPAGLACAQQLVRVGYAVTVLEKADRAGGLLRYGIPDFRLEKSVLERRLAQLEAEGIEFRTGVHAGVTMQPGDIRQNANAVVLACGVEQPREVNVPGRRLGGIYLAMPYLEQQNRRIAGDSIDPDTLIDAQGKDVVVIGGGDTGRDCVGTAIRQGARQVIQIQYHERPPRHANVLRYWPEPMPVLRIADTDEEGCKRIWGWATVAFDGREDRVSSVLLQRLQWTKRADGSWHKHHFHEPPQRLPAQLVIIAIGFAHPVHEGIVETLALDLDGCGNVLANSEAYTTSKEGVFACGDMRRGQSLIVWAIREGRQCARAVDMYLSGYSELPYV